MAYYFKPGTRSSFFDRVSRLHVEGGVVKVEQFPTSAMFKSALRNGWVKTSTEEEYNAQEGIKPKVVEEKAKPAEESTKYDDMTKKEILKEFDWMEEEDLAEASKKKKSEMIKHLLKVEKEYSE